MRNEDEYIFVEHNINYYYVHCILQILEYNINMMITRIIIINNSIITLKLEAIMTVELPSPLVDVIIERPVEQGTK